MNQYQQRMNHYRKLFNERNDRERALIGFCVAALIFTLWQFLLSDPSAAEQDKLNSLLSNLQIQITSVDKQYRILQNVQKHDPDSEIKKRISIANAHLKSLDEQLQLKMKGLILPTQMAGILEQVLTQKTKLKFKRIQSLAAKPLLVETQSHSNDQALSQPIRTTPQLDNTASFSNIGVYQHGIELEFSGRYLDTLAYLQQLEQLPWKFYWDAIEFDVVEYPSSNVIIRVHTLSLKEGWLGV